MPGWLDAAEAELHAATRDELVAQWAAETEAERGTSGGGAVRLVALAAGDLCERLAERGAACEGAEARRCELLHRRLLLARVEGQPEIAALVAELTLASWSAAAGDDARLALLRGDGDRGRRERAWRERAALGHKLWPRLRELVERRNDAARELGAASYYAFRLRLAELDVPEVDRALVELGHASEAPWREARDALLAMVGAGPLAPWDLHLDPHGTGTLASSWLPNAAEAAEAALRASGFSLPTERVRVEHGRPATFAIDPPGDVRVLLPVGAGLARFRTALHELGHALYSAGHDAALPWSLRDAPAPCLHEAVAQRISALAGERAWLVARGVPEQDAARLADGVRHEQAIEARLLVLQVGLERALYEGADPVASWQTLGMQHLGFDVRGSARAWARVPHLVLHPTLLASYAVAAGIATGLRAAPEWLTARIFRPGATWPWRELLARAAAR